MAFHLHWSLLELIALGRAHDGVLIRAKAHLNACATCARDLNHYQAHPTALRIANTPLSVMHETIEGPFHSLLARGPDQGWFARHWGANIEGGMAANSVVAGNEYLVNSFHELFPEHECRDACHDNE